MSDNAAKLVHLLDDPTLVVESLSSGTGLQNPSDSPGMLYLDITGGTAGTVKVELSYDNGGTYSTIIPATAANAAASHQFPVLVPSKAYVKVTVSVAAIASAIFALH